MKVRTRSVEREARWMREASVKIVMEWINDEPGSCAELTEPGGQFDVLSCPLVVNSGGYRFGVKIGDWVVKVNNTFVRMSDEQFWSAYEAM